jgi:hypothetical protein
MPKLTDTQSLILSRAATRPGNLAMPLPDGLHGAAAKKVVTMMTKRGWLEEVDADLRKGEPLWRETGDGHGTTLIATEVGLAAIGIEPVVAHVTSAARKASTQSVAPSASDIPAQRAGTKQAQVIEMLQRPDGASIKEIVAATAWLPHTARWAGFSDALGAAFCVRAFRATVVACATTGSTPIASNPASVATSVVP